MDTNYERQVLITVFSIVDPTDARMMCMALGGWALSEIGYEFKVGFGMVSYRLSRFRQIISNPLVCAAINSGEGLVEALRIAKTRHNVKQSKKIEACSRRAYRRELASGVSSKPATTSTFDVVAYEAERAAATEEFRQKMRRIRVVFVSQEEA